MAKPTRPVEMLLCKVSNGMTWPFKVTFMLPIDHKDDFEEDFQTLTQILLAKGVRPLPTINDKPTYNAAANMPRHKAEKLIENAPNCPVHNRIMTKSKHQNSRGKVFFYCPERDHEGYCNWRGSAPTDGGEAEVWKSTKR